MTDLLRDLRIAARTLLRQPGVTIVAVLSLALAIGANTAIFSLLNAVFLRGLPMAEADRLVAVYTTQERQAQGGFMPVSFPNYLDLREGTSEVFSSLIDVIPSGAALAIEGQQPRQVGGQLVSSDYFVALGVEPVLGRGFLSDENRRGGEPVVVVSYNFWRDDMGGASDVVGSRLPLNGQEMTIVGVAPAGFKGTFTLFQPDFWAPLGQRDVFVTGQRREWLEERRALMTLVYGRLAPGVSREQAEAALATVGTRLRVTYPKANEERNFTLLPLDQAMLNPGQRGLFVRAGGLLMTVVGLVLLLAAVNVANLLLGRALARRKEMAIRMAQGAQRWQVVRQLLGESLLLGLVAGVLGLVLAWWARGVLWALRPPFLQQSALDLSFDGRVLTFNLVVSIVTALAFGVLPALRASRVGLVDDLKGDGSGRQPGRRLGGRALVVVQVGLSFVALFGAGLFVRSLQAMSSVELGYEPGRLAMLSFDTGRLNRSPGEIEQLLERVLSTAANLPGVERASLSTYLPLAAAGLQQTVLVEGRDPQAPDNGLLTPVNVVSEGYFQTAGIDLLRGRPLTDRDRADVAPVVVINQAMAKQFWSSEEPVGARFHFFGEEEVREVVGVVADSKFQTVGEEPRAQVFLPLRQNFRTAHTLAVRAGGDPALLVDSLRGSIQQLVPELPLTGVQTVDTSVEQALWAPRMAAGLLSVLGLLALLLASIGIYGVMSSSVRRRDREIGIRMALGARRRDVLGLVIRGGMVLVGAGLAVGLVAALLLGPRIETLLHGVSGRDLATLVAMAVLLGFVALLANLIPASRAAGVDPVSVLRAER